MRIRSAFQLKGGVAALALAAALAMGGCNRANEARQGEQSAATATLPDLPATLPLSAGAATAPTYAPPADALPDVAPIRTVRVADPGRSYAYADSAYDFADALGDAPPDYAFDYDGVDPWAWQGYDDSTVFAEPLDDGYRYYYYRAGADAPYFVRDPSYGYGYDGGNLAVVYANDGAIVPWADYGPRVVYASRYLTRGRELWRASRARRAPVIAANWDARRPAILQSRRAWAEARVQQPGWAAYRTRYNREARDYWQPEARRREADARRYAAWQARDYRTAPPPRAIPASWQRASWARDERRYAPAREERRGFLAERREDRRGEQFAAQRQQAIAAREQALAARQQAREARFDQRGDPRAARQDERADRQALRQQREAARLDAGRGREAQAAAFQQREAARGERQAQLALRQEREQARMAAGRDRAAQRADVAGDRQARAAAREQREAARQAQRGPDRDAQLAARQQREQARAAGQARGAERQQREAARGAQRAQREQAQAARQQQMAERAQRGQQRQAQMAERAQRDQQRQAQMAERAQRDQQRQAQMAERAQRDQQRQAQMAERAQQRQAQMAERAQRDQQRQAAGAQRVQAEQQRQAQMTQRAQAGEARAARQQERATRMERGPRGGDGGPR